MDHRRDGAQGVARRLTATGLAGLMLAGLARPAWADGGAGGASNAGAGGAGGTGYSGTNGSTSGVVYGGGGGGSAGGGTGGTGASGTGGAGGTGGTGGSVSIPNGGAGADGYGGGGGGGGGYNGGSVTTLGGTSYTGGNGGGGGGSTGLGGGGGGGGGGYGVIVSGTSVNTNAASISGGSGGAGGYGGQYSGGGGGGGDGGYGALFTGTTATLTNSSGGAIVGGTGGAGGSGGLGVGNGGAGGVGVSFTGSGATITNAGTIAGGAGGSGGLGGGNGGAGIVGANLTITNTGTISGGLSGISSTRANAITFNGGTNTLTLSSGGTQGTIIGNIGITGTLQIDPGTTAGVNATLSNAISGTGTVSKIGAGTLTLSGTNFSYSGTTALAAGKVSIGNAVALGSGGVTFTGTAALETTASIVISNAIVVASNVAATIGATATNLVALIGTFNAGAGATVHFGSGTDTGIVVLQTVSGGTVAASSAAVIDASTLILNSAAGAAALSAMQGGLTVGSGTTVAKLNLNGNPLSVSNLAGTSAGTVTNNGNSAVALALANTANSTFAGAILDGSGALSVSYRSTNGSTLTLTGTSSYTGTTTINSGTLEVDGSLSSGVITVNAGGMLTGSGTITDPIIASGGTLAPGTTANPYGTMTITGPLTFQAGSNYNIAITPTANSRTNVVGAATLSGGTVNVTASNTSYPLSTKYTILNATGGVTGTFASVNTNLAFLTPALGYDANNVYLTVTTTNAVLTPASSAAAATAAAAGVPTTTVAGTTYVVTPDYRTAAITQNQLAVATALTFAAPANPNAPILTALNGTSTAQAQAAFGNLSGEGIAGAATSGLMQSQMFTGAMTDQAALWMDGGSTPNSIVVTAPPAGALGYAALAATGSPIVTHDAPAPVRTWRAWGSGFGADATIHSLGLGGGLGAAAQSDEIYGGAVGLDYQADPTLLVGVAGGGSSGSFTVAGRGTSGAVTGGHVGAYAVKTYAGFYGLASLAGAFYGDTETRMVAGFGGLAGETERGTTTARAIRARLEAGRPVDDIAGLTLTPFVALEVASLHTNGFTETPLSGAGVFALTVMGQDTLSIPAYLGVHLDHTYALDGGMSLKPVVSVAYGHDFAPNRVLTAALATLPAALFQVNGAPFAQNFAETELGVELAFAPGAALFANFDGDFSGREQIYGGKGGIKVMW